MQVGLRRDKFCEKKATYENPTMDHVKKNKKIKKNVKTYLLYCISTFPAEKEQIATLLDLNMLPKHSCTRLNFVQNLPFPEDNSNHLNKLVRKKCVDCKAPSLSQADYPF